MKSAFYAKLQNAWIANESLLCIGLDPQASKLPKQLQEVDGGYFEFCRGVVDATHDLVCAYKPQFAHFAAVGREAELANLIAYIRETYPTIPVILDAKRGDVGSTAEFYAQEAYQRYNADAVTVSPYLGFDSVAPYLEYPDRGIVVLCRTSNPASDVFQNYPQEAPLFERVASTVAEWNTNGQCMLVTGATYPDEVGRVRQIVGDMPLLVPGIGAQGGSIDDVVAKGADANGRGLVISSSREIIYAHLAGRNGDSTAQTGAAADFAAASRRKAQEVRATINHTGSEE